jgi:hypothetical protein
MFKNLLNSDNNLLNNNNLSEIINNNEISDLFGQLGNISKFENISKVNENSDNQENTKEQLENKNNTTPNLLNQLKDLWTNDYYDNENLEDFLVNDNDENNLVKENNVDEIESENNDSEIENKSKYLKLELNKLCVEICLSKFTDIEFKKNLISKLFDKEYYNSNIKQYTNNSKSQFGGLPGVQINRWVETDSDGYKYVLYTLGNSEEKKEFRYEHAKQFKSIIFEFLDFIDKF